MKIHPGFTKRAVIMLWCFCASVYLLSIGMDDKIGVLQFVHFSMLLFGGGVAYHVATGLLSCPQTELNYHIWKDIKKNLLKIFIGYIISGTLIYISVKFGGKWDMLITVLGIVLGGLWIMRYMTKLQIIEKLLKGY